MTQQLQLEDAIAVKTCCAALYQSEWARLLLGDSFHPGGLALTGRLGQLLELQPGQRVLDVAAGRGASAIFLARRFGCAVVGIDYGPEAVAAATRQAEAAGLGHLVCFRQGDAENLGLADHSFDALICECAFCTFPDKDAAAAEFARVLRPGGRIGLSDVTRSGPLPPELEGLLAWMACLAGARPLEGYVAYLEEAGFTVGQTESHPAALAELVRTARTQLLGVELLVKLNKLDLPAGFDIGQAKKLARHAAGAVQAGRLGYALLVGQKR